MLDSSEALLGTLATFPLFGIAVLKRESIAVGKAWQQVAGAEQQRTTPYLYTGSRKQQGESVNPQIPPQC